MATSFKRESKMMTTEPKDDEVGHGMKKGGHASKKHMAMGGMGMMPPPMMKRPATKPPAAMPIMRPATKPPAAMPIMQKEGGKAEKAEMKEMHKVEKELKHHEHMKASKAHHGLKEGGKARAVPGGLLGGVMDKSSTKPAGTGGVRSPGYKHGGKMMHKAEGGLAAKGDAFQARSAMKPKIDVQDKVAGAKQTKSLNTKTGALEGKGYKHGGHTKKHHYAEGGTVKDSVAKRYENTMMHDGEKMPTKKKGTGAIHEGPAGYKHGGHIKHHEHAKHHESGGHVHMHKHSAKHMHEGHEHHSKHETHHKHDGHHTTKMSTHKKAGGMCNY
jgi:hypothetical protein